MEVSMTNESSLEKRQIERLLCDNNFSDCRLQYTDSSLKFQAINFHHQGIGIFGSQRLPLDQPLTLSFIYENLEDENKQAGNKKIEINEIPCRVSHRQEMDVGNQYGIEFICEEITLEAINYLQEIETLLKKKDNGDRYGLF
jgi:hypothetical protein